MQYVLDTNRYAIDPLDGEIIVMDMLEGRLFLFEEGGAVVWDCLARGVPVEVFEREIAARYGEATLDAVRVFVASLVAKDLLIEGVPEAAVVGAMRHTDWPADLGELRMSEYDDMTSIITMDPIHDVDPKRGWPFDERM
jgi:hypothetical protein